MRYQVSEVQPTEDFRVAFAGVGFNVLDDRGAPIVTFAYLDATDAANARALLNQAIRNAMLITSARR